MSTEATRARFPWGLTVVCAVVFALLVSLGVWQVQRLQWKQDLIAAAGEAARRPPVPLHQPEPPPVPFPPPNAGPVPAAPMADTAPRDPYVAPHFPEFQRVIVSCHWWNRNFVELRSIRDGVSGIRVISQCDGFLVDRGFIPDGVSGRPPFIQPIMPPSGPGTPIVAQARTILAPGLLAPPPAGRVFYARDIKAMTEALGGNPERAARQMLFAEQSTAPDLPELIAEPPPAAFSNNHLGYALTWFGLALVLVGFYIALLRRKTAPKPPRSGDEPHGTKENS